MLKSSDGSRGQTWRGGRTVGVLEGLRRVGHVQSFRASCVTLQSLNIEIRPYICQRRAKNNPPPVIHLPLGSNSFFNLSQPPSSRHPDLSSHSRERPRSPKRRSRQWRAHSGRRFRGTHSIRSRRCPARQTCLGGTRVGGGWEGPFRWASNG